MEPAPTRTPRTLAYAILAAIAVLLAASFPSGAVITGGCTASATASRSGAVDLTTATEWHLRSDDVVNGSGKAPTVQTTAQVSAYAFGIAFPLVSATGRGTGGSAGPFDVATYARLARIIAVAGSSDSCSGSITIIIDDVNPFLTATGGGGAVLGLLGLLGVLRSAFSRGGGGARVGGALAGLLGGLGLGLLLQQTGTLDPANLVGLVVPLAGLVIGGGAAGMLKRGG